MTEKQKDARFFLVVAAFVCIAAFMAGFGLDSDGLRAERIEHETAERVEKVTRKSTYRMERNAMWQAVDNVLVKSQAAKHGYSQACREYGIIAERKAKAVVRDDSYSHDERMLYLRQLASEVSYFCK